ncbi:uncharacterized protein LOC121423805 [Lytechinus variegatus]|uniref:uncharacterized protein LOC121423805 n=1 Tax=Lytechinus variegatus TaxID=7654 RepID=UPI001BB210E0|nr:uncharacterized protein LOC121423805 [Lytechinus variegatus]
MVDKDALFDELSKKFPAGKYTTFCNKMGVGYNEAKSMLTRCKEDYNVALRDLLGQWDDRMKGVTRKQIEDALIAAEVGGLCSIVRKYYEADTRVDAASDFGAGDATVQTTSSQRMNQSEKMVHMNQRGVPNTSAATGETEAVASADIRKPARQQIKKEEAERKNVKNVASDAGVDDDEDDVIGGGGGDGSSMQTQQVTAVRQRIRGEEDRKQEMQPVEVMDSNHGAVNITGDRQRGGDPTSNFTLDRSTETRDGDKTRTTVIWTGVGKEQMAFLGIVLCVGIGLFIYSRRKH